MDLRIQKTRQNIFQAFIELREKYPLEKITVKELTERAQISKQTFYLHYRDMYDLSERIEQSMIQEMLKELPYPENILTHTGEVTKQLFQKAHKHIYRNLFYFLCWSHTLFPFFSILYAKCRDYATPNNSASLSSFRLLPMTQSLPV